MHISEILKFTGTGLLILAGIIGALIIFVCMIDKRPNKVGAIGWILVGLFVCYLLGGAWYGH